MSKVTLTHGWISRLKCFKGGKISETKAQPPEILMEIENGFKGSNLDMQSWLFLNQHQIEQEVEKLYKLYLDTGCTFRGQKTTEKQIHELGLENKISFSDDIYYDYASESFLPKKEEAKKTSQKVQKSQC